ncbi:MAG TPA: hypothetical protein VL979_00345 [Solirubrobacteraceae bacterium]|nr:hypothetical protein [Solirubrobacteraceae bacterium]
MADSGRNGRCRAAALVALAGAYVTIRDNRRTALGQATHAYIVQLSDPALLPLEAVMTTFLRGGMRPSEVSWWRWRTMDDEARRESAKALWRDLNASAALEDRSKLLEILAYPNLLEGLASMYNEGLLDRRMVKAQVEVDARSFWTAARWWIDQLRDENGEDTFRDVEVMLQDLASQELPSWYQRSRGGASE